MKNKNSQREKLSQIRSGVRLKTKPPKRETPATVYSRKEKHKRRFNTSSYSFADMNIYFFGFIYVQ